MGRAVRKFLAGLVIVLCVSFGAFFIRAEQTATAAGNFCTTQFTVNQCLAQIFNQEAVAAPNYCTNQYTVNQCLYQIFPAGFAGPVVAPSNLTFYVATTGSDSNAGTFAKPFLTVQKGVNTCAGYNFINLYSCTINVADGTYTNSVTTLSALVNSPLGGSIIGDISTDTNVKLADDGAHFTFTSAPFSVWTINGVDLHGTYGGMFQPAQWSSLTVNNINISGTLPNDVFDTQGGLFSAISATITTTASTMGKLFDSSKAIVVIDFATITFVNAVTVPSLITTIGFVAADDAHFINAANVTSSGAALLVNDNGFFEADSTTLVDGVAMTRANFPGHGGGFNIDAWSAFQPDGPLTYFGSAIVLNGSGAALHLNDTETNGQNWQFFPSVNGTTPYFAFYAANPSDFIPIAFNVDGNNSAQITSGGCFGWISTTRYAAFSNMDTCFSRTGAATVALGNGTPGNTTGTLTLAHLTATSLANSATTSAVCYNTSTGVLTYDGTVGTCTTSDERLKNIGPRIDNALDKLLKINGFYFTWRDARYGTGKQIGVGAQTVEKVFPELVSTGSDGIKSVDYQKLVAPIIEALRELKVDNDNLHAEIARIQRHASR
jgi:hypothetical protein